MLNLLYLLPLQLPFGTRNPQDNKPIDFSSPFDVIVFIIGPILMIIFYFYWKRTKKNEEDDQNRGKRK